MNRTSAYAWALGTLFIAACGSEAGGHDGDDVDQDLDAVKVRPCRTKACLAKTVSGSPDLALKSFELRTYDSDNRTIKESIDVVVGQEPADIPLIVFSEDSGLSPKALAVKIDAGDSENVGTASAMMPYVSFEARTPYDLSFSSGSTLRHGDPPIAELTAGSSDQHGGTSLAFWTEHYGQGTYQVRVCVGAEFNLDRDSDLTNDPDKNKENNCSAWMDIKILEEDPNAEPGQDDLATGADAPNTFADAVIPKAITSQYIFQGEGALDAEDQDDYFKLPVAYDPACTVNNWTTCPMTFVAATLWPPEGVSTMDLELLDPNGNVVADAWTWPDGGYTWGGVANVGAANAGIQSLDVHPTMSGDYRIHVRGGGGVGAYGLYMAAGPKDWRYPTKSLDLKINGEDYGLHPYSGTITVEATATGNLGIELWAFQLGNVAVNQVPDLITSPSSFTQVIDTTKLPNGEILLYISPDEANSGYGFGTAIEIQN